MGRSTTFSKPLLLQSKLLCFSLLYLFSALSLAVFFSSSSTRCLFRSSPFDPIQSPLFSYPSSYGEHKHSIPTTRSSCESPVFFSDYSLVFDEMQRVLSDSSAKSSSTIYMQGSALSFGGNLSFPERLSHFNHTDDDDEIGIPCGFFKRFPISTSDRASMEKCDGLVVVSAIFNDHDKIRQPRGLGSSTLSHACFFMFVDDATLNRLRDHNIILIPEDPTNHKELKIGAWRIINVFSSLYENPAMNGVVPKHLIHRLFPNSKYSIWVDAKVQLVVDPFLLIHSLVVKENVDMAISRHPFFRDTMEEAMATGRWNKWWDVDALKIQMETYCEHGLQPWSKDKAYPTDVPDTALILRKHNLGSNMFSCLLFNELDAFNPRDQLAFAFVRDKMSPKPRLNMFEVEVFEQVAIEYRHNLKSGRRGHVGHKIKMATTPHPSVNRSCGKCEGYLLNMWGESHD